MDTLTRILVADPSPLFRLGVRLALARVDQPLVIEEADRLVHQCAHLKSAPEGRRPLHSFDLIILAQDLPGLASRQQLRALKPPVLLMTPSGKAALQSQSPWPAVAGHLPKNIGLDQLNRCVTRLLSGLGCDCHIQREAPAGERAALRNLSSKQQRVLELVREGMSNKQIAAHLHLSESAVKHHITRIYRVLDFKSPNRTLLALQSVPDRVRASA
ncbi:response regulator transcription factor [Motiliproteus sp. SC1-56]|uniref:response regulator transcription factor n=1 Tax=Motiliproteus sp. SC1-56 TaxID=2799565 RepID=UPI001A8E0624|nr:response regulator transcription factor [Motiliproteus sp. SC1-56]